MSGSKLVRSSPDLIAAYHVLHRLSAPRHPPNTLKTLDRFHDRCPIPSAKGPDRHGSHRDSPVRDPSIHSFQDHFLLRTHPTKARGQPAFMIVTLQGSKALNGDVGTRSIDTDMTHRPGRSFDPPSDLVTSMPQHRMHSLFTMTNNPRRTPSPARQSRCREARRTREDAFRSWTDRQSSRRTPARPTEWWSLTDSNRRHPACKAGALPAELRPHSCGRSPQGVASQNSDARWWAWEDLNFRPHAYQARALTN